MNFKTAHPRYSVHPPPAHPTCLHVLLISFIEALILEQYSATLHIYNYINFFRIISFMLHNVKRFFFSLNINIPRLTLYLIPSVHFPFDIIILLKYVTVFTWFNVVLTISWFILGVCFQITITSFLFCLYLYHTCSISVLFRSEFLAISSLPY